MRKEKGITLISLAVTVMIMILLAGILITASNYNKIVQEKDAAESDFEEEVEQTDQKIDSIQEQWGDVLSK